MTRTRHAQIDGVAPSVPATDLGEVLRRYDRVICPEMNLGQLSLLLRGKYLVDVESHTQVRGLPFRAAELAAVIQEVIDRTSAPAAPQVGEAGAAAAGNGSHQ